MRYVAELRVYIPITENRFMKTLACYIAAIAASSLTAQSVTFAANLTSTAQLVASIGAQSTTQQLGAGSLSVSGKRTASLNFVGGQVRSEIEWSTWLPVFDDKIQFQYEISGAVGSAGTASAAVAPHDVVVTLQAAAWRDVTLFTDITTEVSPNGIAPRMDVDIGDDGTIEFSTTQTAGSVTLSVGPTPLQIRISTEGQANTPGSINPSFRSRLLMRIEPDNHISKSLVAAGCANLLVANQAFAHDGIRLEVPYTFSPVIAVLGLSAQPALLPSGGAQLPCLLVPSLDLVVLLPANGGFNLPIPPALRPINIYVQGVELVATNALWSTAAYLFGAY